MSTSVVRTKEELEIAKKQGVEEILVVGELADKIKQVKMIAKASPAVIAVIAAAIMANKFMGKTPVHGFSTISGAMGVASVVPVAAMTGFEIAAIITAASIGIALLVALFKDYEEIECGNGTYHFRKRAKG